MELIDKDALVQYLTGMAGCACCDENVERIIRKFIIPHIDTLEVEEVDLIIHTVIAECCDWLAMNTNLSHDKIEGCRNLMLTVKEEQFKAQKGEEL